MNSLTWILTNDGGLSIIANGRHFTVARSHQNFDAIKAAIKRNDAHAVIDLIDVQQKVREFVQKAPQRDGFKVEVKNGCIYVNDQIIDNELSRRTKQFMDEGLPFEHMVLFLQNVLDNPSFNSQKQLYRFLSNHKLPITSDGHFLAYKGVKMDWTDCQTGKICNKPGVINEMPRYAVDDNPANDCSHGFHAGTVSYARGYANNGHLVLVKINPKDVVSVPNSCAEKLRCCKYEVIACYENDLDHPLYDAPSGGHPSPIMPPPAPPQPAQPFPYQPNSQGTSGPLGPPCDSFGCSPGTPPSGVPDASAAAMEAMSKLGMAVPTDFTTTPSQETTPFAVAPALADRDGAGTSDEDEDEDEEEDDLDDDEEDLDDDDEDLDDDDEDLDDEDFDAPDFDDEEDEDEDEDEEEEEDEDEEVLVATPVDADYHPTGNEPVAVPLPPGAR